MGMVLPQDIDCLLNGELEGELPIHHAYPQSARHRDCYVRQALRIDVPEAIWPLTVVPVSFFMIRKERTDVRRGFSFQGRSDQRAR